MLKVTVSYVYLVFLVGSQHTYSDGVLMILRPGHKVYYLGGSQCTYKLILIKVDDVVLHWISSVLLTYTLVVHNVAMY